jgi:beta-lactamase regulating signal transducer with metallopeptidase domain
MLWWFAETTLVAAVLAVVAALASGTRRLGPAARHALWLLVLVKLIMPPLVRCRLPALPAWSDRSRETSERRAPQIDASAASFRLLSPEVLARLDAGPVPPARETVPTLDRIGAVAPRWVLGLWVVVSTVLAVGQSVRVLRFRRLLRDVSPAPEWLIDEAERVGERLGVCVPEVVVVPTLRIPSLWCLGRPKLLLPAALVKSEGVDRWRGILAHELAHLRRGDHWVGRLELLAGLIWWWNPLYHLARRRTDAEAELACDAWVLWAFPEDRLHYAETLYRVCASLSRVEPLVPALGIAGSGRFLERRLTMIVRDEVSCRRSFPALLGAGLLALLALPSWTTAEPSPVSDDDETSPAASAVGRSAYLYDALVAEPAEPEEPEEPEAEADTPDDEDDAPSADRAESNAKKKAKEKKARAKRATKSRAGVEVDIDLSGLEEALGPDSEFAKSLEKILKQIREQLGPGSDFEKQTKDLAESIEKHVRNKAGSGAALEKRAKKLEAEAKVLEEKAEAEAKSLEKKLEAEAKSLERKLEADARVLERKLEAEAKALEGQAREMGRRMLEQANANRNARKPDRETEGSDRVGPSGDAARAAERARENAARAAERGREHAERARENAARAAERAHEHAARAAEREREHAARAAEREHKKLEELEKAKKRGDGGSKPKQSDASERTRENRIKQIEERLEQILKELKELKGEKSSEPKTSFFSQTLGSFF